LVSHPVRRPVRDAFHDFDDRIGHALNVRVVGDDIAEGRFHALAEALLAPVILGFGKIAAWAGWPALAKWFVPLVKAPGTMIEVSMPQRASSRAYWTASMSIVMDAWFAMFVEGAE
jgi:hypothetical protein